MWRRCRTRSRRTSPASHTHTTIPSHCPFLSLSLPLPYTQLEIPWGCSRVSAVPAQNDAMPVQAFERAALLLQATAGMRRWRVGVASRAGSTGPANADRGDASPDPSADEGGVLVVTADIPATSAEAFVGREIGEVLAPVSRAPAPYSSAYCAPCVLFSLRA